IEIDLAGDAIEITPDLQLLEIGGRGDGGFEEALADEDREHAGEFVLVRRGARSDVKHVALQADPVGVAPEGVIADAVAVELIERVNLAHAKGALDDEGVDLVALGGFDAGEHGRVRTAVVFGRVTRGHMCSLVLKSDEAME